MNAISPIHPVSDAKSHHLKLASETFISNTNGTSADSVTNSTSFSSYIEQALAQIGISTPTSANTYVIHNTDQVNSSEKSLSIFIQDLFTVLGKEDAEKQAKSTVFNQQQSISHSHSSNEAAIAAYAHENSTTVGNIVGNLQTLIQHLNNKVNGSNMNQELQDSFQSIFDNSNSSATLNDFLQTLMQNLQGQNPLGVIINTKA